MLVLHRSAHFVIEHHRQPEYVRLVRSASGFASLEQAKQALEACGVVLKRVDASRLGIVLDWRQATVSSDMRLHQVIVENTDAFARRFRRQALLVATPLGRLQARRLAQATSPEVFCEAAAAIAYVTSR